MSPSNSVPSHAFMARARMMMKPQFWKPPPLGARMAASSRRGISSSGTLRASIRRIARVVYSASNRSIRAESLSRNVRPGPHGPTWPSVRPFPVSAPPLKSHGRRICAPRQDGEPTHDDEFSSFGDSRVRPRPRRMRELAPRAIQRTTALRSRRRYLHRRRPLSRGQRRLSRRSRQSLMPAESRRRDALPHVVIVGGGFGGLAAARALRDAPVRLTLIDRTNHHLFQPLLYQVATCSLSSVEITSPIRHLLRHQENASVMMTEVLGVEPRSRLV